MTLTYVVDCPLVIDVLSPEQLRRMCLAADRIMSHIDTSEIN